MSPDLRGGSATAPPGFAAKVIGVIPTLAVVMMWLVVWFWPAVVRFAAASQPGPGGLGSALFMVVRALVFLAGLLLAPWLVWVVWRNVSTLRDGLIASAPAAAALVGVSLLARFVGAAN